MIWKFTYSWWYDPCKKEIKFVKAETEDDAFREFDKHFGYEDIDVREIEKSSIEEVLKTNVWGY